MQTAQSQERTARPRGQGAPSASVRAARALAAAQLCAPAAKATTSKACCVSISPAVGSSIAATAAICMGHVLSLQWMYHRIL
jgi:hypothetical protein